MTHHVNGRLRTFIVLVVLIVGAFIIVKAVESKGVEVKVEKKAVLATTWYFIGNEDSDTDDPSNYSTEPLDNIECGGLSEILCSITDTPNPTKPNQPNMSFGLVSQDAANQYNKLHRVD